MSSKNQRFYSSSSDSDGALFDHNRIPRPQERAPDFKGKAVVNKQFKEIQLSDYEDKWLCLFFYPLDL